MTQSDAPLRDKILRAGLELFGSQGFAATTVRQIANRAGVSVGLVNHHFGSKEGLRIACDEWAMSTIGGEKNLFAEAGGSLPELGRYLDDHPEFAPLMDYLTTTFREGGPAADRVFDLLVEVSENLLKTGIAAGTIRPVEDVGGLAAVLTAYSLGASLLSKPLATKLGGESLLDKEAYAAYARISLDLFQRGLLITDWLLPDSEASAAPEVDADPR